MEKTQHRKKFGNGFVYKFEPGVETEQLVSTLFLRSIQVYRSGKQLTFMHT